MLKLFCLFGFCNAWPQTSDLGLTFCPSFLVFEVAVIVIKVKLLLL